MTTPFYAPLKSPEHPTPSGDRTMGRLLFKALAEAGLAPELASSLRTLDLAGSPALQERLRREALAEADRLIAEYRKRPAASRPRLWFTYHVYYKAPDWIGPRVADALRIPYVVAEGSRAAKRAVGPWALGHQGAEAALDRADLVFLMTEADREGLQRGRPAAQRLVELPPFLDLDAWLLPGSRPAEPRGGPVRLLTVAMMRAGDKLASYALLAEALQAVRDRPWTLDIAGDGEAREAVQALLAPFGERVRFHGAVSERGRLQALYRAADLLVWPAVNEAYGMALLEAQAHGCPVVAGAYGGVPSVVLDGVTGCLARPGEAGSFAGAVAGLLDDPARRRRLGAAARRFVVEERSLGQAARRLSDGVKALLPDEALS